MNKISFVTYIYELYYIFDGGCSESNASYFIMLTHNIRDECWWYSSRGWIFPSVFHYMLLLCDRWQQRGTLTEWCLTWKCIWSKGMPLKFSMWKKWHPLTFTDSCWTFMETEHWMWAQWGSGCCVSAVVRVTVGHLCWYRLLWAQHVCSCWLLGRNA